MEDFSEEQKTRAVKFFQTYVSEYGASDAGQLRAPRSHFTVEELEGECLQMARTYLSGKSVVNTSYRWSLIPASSCSPSGGVLASCPTISLTML